MELLSLFCYVAIKRNSLAGNQRAILLYSMLPMLTVTAPLISLNGTMIRVGQYFTLYMMLLVPRAIDLISKGNIRQMFYFGMIAVLIFMSLNSRDFEYYFFWQNVL